MIELIKEFLLDLKFITEAKDLDSANLVMERIFKLINKWEIRLEIEEKNRNVIE